jgi:hypothetical protein
MFLRAVGVESLPGKGIFFTLLLDVAVTVLFVIYLMVQ